MREADSDKGYAACQTVSVTSVLVSTSLTCLTSAADTAAGHTADAGQTGKVERFEVDELKRQLQEANARALHAEWYAFSPMDSSFILVAPMPAADADASIACKSYKCVQISDIAHISMISDLQR